jgi:hypothetical protein
MGNTNVFHIAREGKLVELQQCIVKNPGVVNELNEVL